mmetsp:Transcript_18205/g.30595  ORF Transcript_18205/g.30595 Transcript_18205/m.30595 type:complete len:144 (+) Transcript_18205:38-469(+)
MDGSTASMCDGAAIVHKFLRKHNNQLHEKDLPKNELIEQLTKLIQAVIPHTYDEVFESILGDFRWNEDNQTFNDNQHERIDLDGLRIALAEKSRSFFTSMSITPAVDELTKASAKSSRNSLVRAASVMMRRKPSIAKYEIPTH